METIRDENPNELPLEVARLVHQICEKFEADHREGKAERLQDLVQSWAGLERAYLLLELILLEDELRLEAGETSRVREYLEQLPEDRPVIESAMNLVDSDKTVQWSARGAPPRVAILSELSHLIGEDYKILEELGRGGQGVVYKSYQISLKREVALKALITGRLASQEERERFRLEAERAANLVHRHIVPIYAIGENDGQAFFTMELVDGGNLANIKNELMNHPLRAAHLISSIARAIHFAHGKGFIHCDLKPANILLNKEGKPYVTDFGLSRALSVDGESPSGEIFGTPSYMAPEQADGGLENITPATDVYGLGAILYEILTGRPPFRGPTTMETVMQVIEREPTPPRAINPGISQVLERICLKCLEKSPRDRYSNASEVHEALEAYLRGDDVEGDSPWQKLRRETRRQPELVSRVVGLFFLMLLTEYNHHYATANANQGLHYLVQAILLFWAMISIPFQQLLRIGYRAEAVRLAWSAFDILALTSIIFLLDGFGTELLVGYPVVIALSGLWFNIRLVWLTTALALVGYLTLALIVATTQPYHFNMRYVDIFVLALLITGFVVLRQVKRILVLSNYYRHRHDG